MKSWSADETNLLLFLVSNGNLNYDIAQKLQRTPKAIKEKLNKLRVTSNKPKLLCQVECIVCTIVFDANITDNRKFCSRSCACSHNNKLYIKRTRLSRHTCLRCNMNLVRGSKIYCSRSCFQMDKLEKRIASGTYSETTAKLWLLKQEHCCSLCKMTTWNNQPIPLEMDHIDGNPTDHSLTNIRLLCPNCHAQTPTAKGKNRGNGRFARRKRYKEGKSS